MEHGFISQSDRDRPQGGSISVVLVNIFLHYVLDLWFLSVETMSQAKAVRFECR
jgi:retron-type reverse transcriptase